MRTTHTPTPRQAQNVPPHKKSTKEIVKKGLITPSDKKRPEISADYDAQGRPNSPF
ncbi:MAG: hypothetical protein Q8R79_08345 [Legionellaceae bacterium]|nr:hypothetical protein [Legionellaceae bacterium]